MVNVLNRKSIFVFELNIGLYIIVRYLINCELVGLSLLCFSIVVLSR